MAELGEQLPTYRPPLDLQRHLRRSADRRGRPARGDGALPDAALEVVDPLRVPGQPVHAAVCPAAARSIWMSPQDARADRRGRQRLDRGRTTATAWSSPGDRDATACQREPSTCTTPRTAPSTCRSSEVSGARGGIHNCLTRLLIKPTHLIGGYAPALLRLQLLRPDRQPARRDHRHPSPQPGGRVLMRVMAQMGDGHEPRQVHRLPHLLGHLQAGLDQPDRRRVRVVQQRGDQARASATRARYEDQEQWQGGWALDRRGPAARSGRAGRCASCDDLRQPRPARRSTTTTSRGPTTTTRSSAPRAGTHAPVAQPDLAHRRPGR